MKKTAIFLAISVVSVASLLSATFFASSSAEAAYVYSYNTCTNLNGNLYAGLSDASTAGQVSILQNFLISNGYITSVRVATGYFGSITTRAVANYQMRHGIFGSGSIDAATLAAINSESCNGATYNTYNNGYQNGYYGGTTNYNNGYNYNNNYTYGNYYVVPTLSSLSLYAGSVGTSVTIYGTGFDSANNTVNFNGTALTGLSSNGTSIIFTIPQTYNSAYSYNNNYPTYNTANVIGVYPITVTTSRGTSNAINFSLTYSTSNTGYCNGIYYNGGYNNTYNGNCYTGPVSVSNVSGPSTIAAGTTGTWSLSLYNPNTNLVSVNANWGDQNVYGYTYNTAQSTQTSYVAGQQTITFTHIYQTAGTYTVVFTATNSQGAPTSVSATVAVTGSSYVYPSQNPISIYSISPSSARVGTQVTIYGSGFSTYGNVVHFGNGGAMNIPSSNGSSLYYTIPSTVSGCNITSGYGTACPLYAQSITPGSYPIYVTNSYGQISNTTYFTVSLY